MKRHAFTLIELLIVVAVIALLMTILLPSLSTAVKQARSALCQSNLRQVHLANENYVAEWKGYYVPAAPDIFVGFGGRRRWHGVREASSMHPNPAKNTFDPMKGPLRASLSDGQVKRCPETVDFVTSGTKGAYEAGCGGYGYNSVGVGSRTYEFGYTEQAMQSSMKSSEILKASTTVMFADTAMLQGYKQKYLIEYSFCEPPYMVVSDWTNGGVKEFGRPIPSIHFRHMRKANVVWCDGHAGGEEFTFSTIPGTDPIGCRIGWFGPDSNELFDGK